MGSLVGVVVLVLGLGLVVAGGELFFDGLLGTAASLGVSAFVLTVVVSGFELENLAAGIAADLKGLGNAAAGTFLGGTTCMALGVTGVVATVTPILARPPGAVLLFSAMAPLPLLGLGLDGGLSRVDGGVLIVWAVAVIAAIAYAGRAQVPTEAANRRSSAAVVRMLGGLAVLVGAGVAIGDGLRRMVSGFGVSQSLLGNTAIAAAVELEEVGRVGVPARRERGDIALGNVFGTIAHFTAFNAGVIALVRPIRFDATTLHLHLPVAAGSVLLLAAMTAWRGGVGRLGGLLLLVLYAGYIVAAIVLST